jgi:ribonucleoside-diphosphate reductase alpha chain
VPEEIRKVFITASDVSTDAHIHMQAALQAFTDASISKTVNFPATATEEDVAHAFQLAWKRGCKGLPVYIASSREKEVLETEASRQQKAEGKAVAAAETPVQPLKPWQGPAIRPRPQRLKGAPTASPPRSALHLSPSTAMGTTSPLRSS